MRIAHVAYGAALAVAAALGVGGAASVPLNLESPRLAVLPNMPVIAKASKKLRTSTMHPRNGNREVARRLRQIAAGQLTRSNGLRTHEEVYGRAAA